MRRALLEKLASDTCGSAVVESSVRPLWMIAA